MSVDKYVLFGSPSDEVITPWISAHFGQYKAGNSYEMLNLTSREDFNHDYFGLQSMVSNERIIIKETNFKHSEYHEEKAK